MKARGHQYSGYDNLKMLSGFQEDVTEEEVVRLLEQVGLADAPKKKFEAYSLGMRQRLGIAAAVMGAPELIILDEPINAIDENGVEEITRLILDLQSPDRIIIVACHDQSELELLADEVVVLSQGKIKEIRGCAYEDNQTVEA